MKFFKKSKSDGEAGEDLKIFFATDIHGSNVCYKKFLNAGKFYGAQILILGGDMTGKMVVPIVPVNGGGRWTSSFSGSEVHFDSEADVQSFVKRVSDMGFYPKVMSREEFAQAAAEPEYQDRIFEELIAQRLHEWLDWAEAKLSGQGVSIYVAPGNDDGFFVDPILEESSVIRNLEGKRSEIAHGHEMITTGFSNPTPWQTEREMQEPELYDHLKSLTDQIQDYRGAIFNIHVPPHNAKIDECPALDDELRPISNMGNPVMKPAGSISVRRIIEECQPLVSLHGHIHEGRGSMKIGDTVCINPGSDYSEGILKGCLLTIGAAKVKDVEFTNG